MSANVPPSSATHRTYSFGEFTLDLDRGALLRANRDIKLRPKSFEVLRYLVERQGLLVSRDELLDAIWGQTIVTEDAVTQCLRDIRKALRDKSQEVIRTVPRRGYIFELPVTQHGGQVATSDVPSNGQPARWRRWRLVEGLVLVLGIAVTWWSLSDRFFEPPATDAPYAIAVMPFVDLSEGQDQEYFADGIAEEILNLLAWIPELRVIARTSSFSFKGQNVDIATIKDQLNVTHVLEGSVRHSGTQVRITAQLIDTSDSTHVWSQTYDRELTAANLFHIQSEIGRAVTSQLKMALSEDQEQRLANVPTENMEAYTAYLIGRQRLTDRKVAELRDAVSQFARAIELDPIFAAAYSGLADACYLFHIFSGSRTHEACPFESNATREEASASLMPLVNKALELDDQSGEAWITRGQLLWDHLPGDPEDMPQYREAHAAFERGLALSPSHSQGYLWYALSLFNAELYDDPPHGWIEAWEQDTWQSVVRRGLEIDPLSVPLHTNLARYPYWTKELDEAYEHAHRIVEIAPDSPRGYEQLAILSRNQSGRMDEAIKWFHKAARLDEKNPGHPFSIGNAYVALGDLEMALAYYGRVRGIVAADATDWQHEILMAEAFAWLGSRRDDADAKARGRLALTDVYDVGRLEIELSLDRSTTRARELLSRFKDQNPVCLAYDADDDEGAACDPVVYFLYGELGDAETARRRHERGIELANTISLGKNQKFFGPYLLKDLALLGRHEEAIDLLEELVQSGWRGSGAWFRFLLYRDILLDAIRDHPRFQAMVAIIESDMAEQLENVREMERSGELPTLEELQAELSSD